MKQLSELVPGDYVFFKPMNYAVFITSTYEDGNFLTCGFGALTEFADSYRPATQEEIEESIKYKKRFIDNAKSIWNRITASEEKDNL
jgi:hypothetical protein